MTIWQFNAIINEETFSFSGKSLCHIIYHDRHYNSYYGNITEQSREVCGDNASAACDIWPGEIDRVPLISMRNSCQTMVRITIWYFCSSLWHAYGDKFHVHVKVMERSSLQLHGQKQCHYVLYPSLFKTSLP